jgi:hypothetical protein
MYFMVKHPEVQEKCREEIHRVCGDRNIKYIVVVSQYKRLFASNY